MDEQLPKASRVALEAAVALSSAILALPFSLTARDALESDDQFLAHPSDYAAHFQMCGGGLLFHVLHSELTALRGKITPWVGDGLYGVWFALASPPSAVGLIGFFVGYR